VEIDQRRIVVLIDGGDQPVVFGDTCPGQFRAVLMQNRMKTVWVVAFTGQPFQPKAVR
jgi:hypothetical protein